MNTLSFSNVGTDLDRTTRLLKHHYLRAFREAGVDLSTEQWVLLDHLVSNADISQTELASGTWKDAPTVSRIVDKLTRKGLTGRERFPNDRRRYNIVVTPLGHSTHARLLPYVEDLRVQTWRGLTEADHDRLTGLLAHIRGNFEPEE